MVLSTKVSIISSLRKGLPRISVFMFLLCCSCKQNKLDVNVSNIKLSVDCKRFDYDLFSLRCPVEAAGINTLRNKYGNFVDRFGANIIKIGSPESPSYAANLSNFLSDNDMRTVYGDVKSQYPNTDELNKELTDAFKHYKYYFPNKTIPQVVTYVSGFNYAIVADDTTLGIGLDMYLGADYKYYQLMQLPKYRTALMRKERIAIDALKSWISTEFEADITKTDLLSQIIHEGKIMYALDALFPAAHDSLKMGYSKKQNDWAKVSEAQIWAYFIDKKLLFSTNYGENMKFLNDAPFTSGLPRDSPPKIGVWLGWQIVRAYMNTKSDISLEALFTEKDAQKTLSQSKYKPAK